MAQAAPAACVTCGFLVPLAGSLRQAFGVTLPLSLLFEAPTVAEMAIAIESALIEDIERMDEDEAIRLAGS